MVRSADRSRRSSPAAPPPHRRLLAPGRRVCVAPWPTPFAGPARAQAALRWRSAPRRPDRPHPFRPDRSGIATNAAPNRAAWPGRCVRTGWCRWPSALATPCRRTRASWPKRTPGRCRNGGSAPAAAIPTGRRQSARRTRATGASAARACADRWPRGWRSGWRLTGSWGQWALGHRTAVTKNRKAVAGRWAGPRRPQKMTAKAASKSKLDAYFSHFFHLGNFVYYF